MKDSDMCMFVNKKDHELTEEEKDLMESEDFCNPKSINYDEDKGSQNLIICLLNEYLDQEVIPFKNFHLIQFNNFFTKDYIDTREKRKEFYDKMKEIPFYFDRYGNVCITEETYLTPRFTEFLNHYFTMHYTGNSQYIFPEILIQLLVGNVQIEYANFSYVVKENGEILKFNTSIDLDEYLNNHIIYNYMIFHTTKELNDFIDEINFSKFNKEGE